MECIHHHQVEDESEDGGDKHYLSVNVVVDEDSLECLDYEPYGECQ
jgi:hypothetical protein